MNKIILAALILCGNIVFAQTDNRLENFQKSLTISDIVETLTNAKGFVMRMRGELNEKEAKIASRAQAIPRRQFAELDSLFQHGDTLIKLYAFGGICTSYPDSIKAEHLKIISFDGSVKIYQQDTDQFPSMKISEIASKIYKIVEKQSKEKVVKAKVNEKIKEFIIEYSKYPESYVSISFNDFHVYSTHSSPSLDKIENSEVYSIEHVYKIKTKSGALIEHKARFKLDNMLFIMIIEEEESNTVSTSPPQLDWWLNSIGRELNNKDRKKLGL